MASLSVFVNEVNLYSAKKAAQTKPIVNNFREKTGIKVNLIAAKAGALLQRISAHGQYTHANRLITTNAGCLYQAKGTAILATAKSSLLNVNNNG